MIDCQKDILMELSKEELVYLIEQLCHSQFLIGEVCIDESKLHIDSYKAVEKIRKYLYRMPPLYDVETVREYLQVEMRGK